MRQGYYQVNIMDINCPYCDKQNQQGSLFCNQCGKSIGNSDHDSEQYMLKKIKQLVDKRCKEFNEEATELKFKTLESIEEGATKWAKIQFTALYAVIPVIIAVLSYVGFSEYKASEEYQELMDKAKETISEHNKYIADATNNIKLKEEEFNKNFKNKMDEIDKFSKDEVETYQATLKETNKKLTKIEKESKRRYEEIIKIEKSRFRIQVHYMDNNHSLWQENIKFIRKMFDKKGFRLSPRNISNVITDKQEIIIFSDTSLEEARTIRKLISPKFKPLEIKVDHTNYNDELDMIIKLCPDSNCIRQPLP